MFTVLVVVLLIAGVLAAIVGLFAALVAAVGALHKFLLTIVAVVLGGVAVRGYIRSR